MKYMTKPDKLVLYCTIALLCNGLTSTWAQPALPEKHAPTSKPVKASPAKQTAASKKNPAVSKPKTALVTPPKSGSALKPKFENLHQLAAEMRKIQSHSKPSNSSTLTKPAAHIADEDNLPLPQASTAAMKKPVAAALTASEKNLEDTDSLPILLDEAQQRKTDQTSSWLMWRMVLSLLAVLGLFFACIKWLLPGLMNRYPTLFSRLQEQEANALGQKTLKTSVYKSQRHSLERVNAQFNVITSTPLGKEKELHLVEIQGRQLIIATTPYTVTFIKELTEPASSAADLNALLGHVGFQEPPASGNGWLKVDEEYNPRSSPYRTTRGVLPQSRIKPETHSELPPSRKIKPKPLAAKVPLPEEYEAPSKYAEPSRTYQPEPPYSQEQPLHLKYLHAESGEHETLKGDGLHALYKEPEEVVLLDDYDDVYQGSPRRH